ncbi:bifunctional metallophosphatase/5'-nucleotidase [Peptoniphilus catoniae]|uniref:bifunctional metallophosphatase/5'-nucleotidase n=1 Tax=Peptoniphilus catoniae TaxID=1660341 RepID=UPI0010FD561F|nr:bifunctional UDP-sugar hydrolase/5'-nucleotidase [Peptoniphilus catoniae]
MKINIFATSDLHGRIIPYDYGSNKKTKNSLANLSTCYKLLKDENSILIDNGDVIKGSFLERFVYDDKNPAIELMNYMGYDIWNLGNHEFNYGLDNIYRLVDNFKGQTLFANSNGNFTPYTIIERSGYKIGFIGINTLLVNEFEGEYLGDFKVLDPVNIIDDILESLSGRTHAIVGLFHLGISDENGVKHAGIKSILDDLKNIDLLDLVISGHTHDGFQEIVYKNVLITQPQSYGRSINKISLEFEDKLVSKKAQAISSSLYEPDPTIVEFFEPYNKKILSYTNKVIGYLKNVSGDYNYDLDDGPLIHLLTEIMLHYYKADVVAFQIDSINTDLEDGPIRRSDIARLYTYSGGEVSLYKIKGEDLKAYINWSSNYYIYDGGLRLSPKRQSFKYKTFDIFGNINYCLDYGKENRITELKRLDGSDIKDDDELIIGMNEYRMNYLTSDKGPLSKKNFPQIASSNLILKDFPFHGTIRELAESYFENLPNNTFVYNGEKNFKIKY